MEAILCVKYHILQENAAQRPYDFSLKHITIIILNLVNTNDFFGRL